MIDKMRFKAFIQLCFATALLAFVGCSRSQPVNTGLLGNTAVDGYDVVAFHTLGKAVKGNRKLASQHGGAEYRFSSAKHRDLFEKDPAKYLPAYGGYCAWAVGAKGDLAGVDIDTWEIIDGRLYLNYNDGIKKKFLADQKALIEAAEKNWPKIVAEKS